MGSAGMDQLWGALGAMETQIVQEYVQFQNLLMMCLQKILIFIARSSF